MTAADRKKTEVGAAVLTELAWLGHPAAITKRGFEFRDGVAVTFSVIVSAGKTTLSVRGDVFASKLSQHGWIKTWREPKGGFRPADVAAVVLSLAEAARRLHADDAKRKRLEARAGRLRDALGLGERGQVSLRATDDDVVLAVQVDALTDDGVSELVDAAKAMGLRSASPVTVAATHSGSDETRRCGGRRRG